MKATECRDHSLMYLYGPRDRSCVFCYERDAEARGIAVDTFVRVMKEVDRAIADGEEEGFVKIHVKKGTDKIVGQSS